MIINKDINVLFFIKDVFYYVDKRPSIILNDKKGGCITNFL
jgi:hypothetical protein